MNKDSRILVTGAPGLIGRALVKALKTEGYRKLFTPNKNEVDYKNQSQVEEYFYKYKPDYVFNLAAKVGGISANSEMPAEFIYDNLTIQNNIINTSYKVKVKKLIFMACSCIYPKEAKQPFSEEDILMGKLEPTNEAFALAKITGIKMCQAYNKQYGTRYVSVVSPNVFGENDNFSLDDSHVVSALIRKIYEAKKTQKDSLTLWGTGKPLREFIYVGDLASALIFCMRNPHIPDIINIGTGIEKSIKDLAIIISDIIGYRGSIFFDDSKPDGMMRKILNSETFKKYGWKPDYSLEVGLQRTIEWYLSTF